METEYELQKFITDTNEMHLTFKFSFESSPYTVTYLDLEIYNSQRYNKENIYWKLD